MALATTGKDKSRFTTVLCCSADGQMVKSMIIFKGLKNAPKVRAVPNVRAVHVTANMSGSMNRELMGTWITDVWGKRGGLFGRQQPSLLVMDSYGTHMLPEFKTQLKETYMTDLMFVPKKQTPNLQVLDVGVNKTFKASLRRSWEDWMADPSSADFTPRGNRRPPSYQTISEWVGAATASCGVELVKTAFQKCGWGLGIQREELHLPLRSLLALADASDPVLQADGDGVSNESDGTEGGVEIVPLEDFPGVEALLGEPGPSARDVQAPLDESDQPGTSSASIHGSLSDQY